jgi:hypothetical protein
MSGRSYTPVELPRETLEDIQRKTDAAVGAVLSRLARVTMEQQAAAGRQAVHGARTPMRLTTMAVAGRAATLEKELATAGAAETAEARHRLRTAAEQAAPQPADPRAEQEAVSRYEAEEARALEALRAAKARQMRLLEVAAALADSRPRGVEVLARPVVRDGSVTLAFVRGTDRASRVDVTIAAQEDRVHIDAQSGAEPIAVDGRAGAVCVGLDQVFAPMIEQARAQGRLRTGPTKERRASLKSAAIDGVKRGARKLATRSTR